MLRNLLAKLSDEAKKAKKKAKKAAVKAVLEDAKKGTPVFLPSHRKRSLRDHKVAANSTNEDKGLDVGPPKDDDPDGVKLLQSQDGLEKAAKFLNPLTTLALNNIDAWTTIYDVAVRRSEYVRNVIR